MSTSFDDRRHAGQVLAERLAIELAGERVVVVLALPRGGVPVAYEVALRLGAPLEVFMVRKLGVPGHEELAMGALASGGTTILNHDLIDRFGIPEAAVRTVIDRERRELVRRELAYGDGSTRVDLEGKTVVLVDDGLATGSTMRAAAIATRDRHPARIIVAVPVGAPASCDALTEVADQVICAIRPRGFSAVGEWYGDFTQTTDDEVRYLLEACTSIGGSRGGEASTVEARDLRVVAAGVELDGHLALPPDPRGLVIFAHGSGSSRHSPRNRFVASELQNAGLATFLVDLLTSDEDEVDARTRQLRFDIDLLTARLVALGDALSHHPATRDLRIGLFGASTGGAAALLAAARRPELIASVVSRGGRPDLAGPALAAVRAPTLLIAGARDHAVVELNRKALEAMRGDHRLLVVPGAAHLFEEPGALGAVARASADWFLQHLPATTRASR